MPSPNASGSQVERSVSHMPDHNRHHRWVPPDVARMIDEIRAEIIQNELALDANAKPPGWGHCLALFCAAVGGMNQPTDPKERALLERSRPIIVRRILAIRRGEDRGAKEGNQKASG